MRVSGGWPIGSAREGRVHLLATCSVKSKFIQDSTRQHIQTSSQQRCSNTHCSGDWVNHSKTTNLKRCANHRPSVLPLVAMQ